MEATRDFLETPPLRKKRILEEVSSDWLRAFEATKASRPELLLAEITWARGGWLWQVRRDEKTGEARMRLVDQWDDTRLPAMLDAVRKDKWFLFLGGQSVSGGKVGSSVGFNMRLGTTLFRDKYDLSFLFNKTSTGPEPKTKATAYGVLGRRLFRLPNQWGYNLGGQITAIKSSGFKAENEVGAVGGINYYLPKGTWDITLSLGDEGTRTLVIGYSIFFRS